MLKGVSIKPYVERFSDLTLCLEVEGLNHVGGLEIKTYVERFRDKNLCREV